MLKKGLSLFLVLLLAISVVAVPVSAVNGDDSAITTENIANDIRVESTNSLGEMLADEYEEFTATEENTCCKIYETGVDGTSVYVDLFTQSDAQLIVALYDDEGKTMYASGVKTVTPEDKVVKVDINIDAMPEYYLIKAYLLDEENNVPLCKQFECNTYTRQMQEFLATTTDDFDSELVMNLDEDKDNNFLVYDENIIFVKGTESTNVLDECDDENRKYTFINADSVLSSLKAGDIISYSTDETEPVIIKVSSISVNGTTVEIYAEDLSLEEAFQFIKIDVSQGARKTSIDTSSLPEGVEYKGVSDSPVRKSDKEVVATGSAIVEEDVSLSEELEYEFDNVLGLDIDGAVNFKVTANLRCYYDFRWFEDDEVDFSFSVAYELGMNLSVELVSVEEKIELGRISFVPVPGVSIGFTPAFVVEGSVETELSGTLSGQIGKKFINGTFYDDNKPAQLDFALKVSAELFLGLSLTPDITIAGAVFTVEMDASAGVLITAKLEYKDKPDFNKTGEDSHGCLSCVEGDMKFVIKLSFTLKLFDCKSLSWTAAALNDSVHLDDFYYSFDLGTGGFTKCPNRDHTQIFIITGADGRLVEGASVNGNLTNALGVVAFYLPMGEHTITISKENVTKTEKINVKSMRMHFITIDYIHDPEEPTDPTEPNPPKPPVNKPEIGVVGSGMCGEFASFTILSDGTVVIAGGGRMYDYAKGISPFEGLGFIKKVIIGGNVSTVGSRAFSNCPNLTDVSVGDSVGYINNDAFAGCTSLNNVELSDKVVEIGDRAFAGCTNLQQFAFPDYLRKIGENAFYSCTNLRRIDIDGYNNVTIGANAFYSCSSLGYVNLGKNVVVVGASAFKKCSSLLTATLSGVGNIQERTFEHCEFLSEVNLGEKVKSIGKYAFQFCLALKEIELPDTVLEVQEGAFDQCSYLTTVVLGTGIQTIGNFAFANNENVTGAPSHLTNIYYRGSASAWNNINIAPYNEELFNATVYYNYTDKSITPTGKSIPASTGAITSEATDLSDEIATPGKYTRAGFVPGSQAVLMLFKGTAEDYKTDQSSLLYITQTTVDENGTAEFTTYGEFTDTYWVAMIYGKCGHTDIQWVNCKNATVLQDGMEICLCTKCGEVIDSKTVVAEKPEHTLGDVNLDGKININDATAMQRAIANMTTLNDRQLISADVNKDGELNINDVTLLQKYLVDLVPYLGVQQ